MDLRKERPAVSMLDRRKAKKLDPRVERLLQLNLEARRLREQRTAKQGTA
jgi:hypothetical protein